MKKKFLPVLLIISIVLIFSSCLDLSMDIQMRRNGSGRIVMEYRYSSLMESIGRLDGNEMLPIIPVGRMDWDRTVERIDGLNLVSFSTRERSGEIVTAVTLEYENTNALITFLNPKGAETAVSQNRINIIIVEPVSAEPDSDLMELIRQVSAGNKFSVSFTGDTNSSLAFYDGNFNEISPPAGSEITASGRKVSFSTDIYNILSVTGGFAIGVNY